MVLSHKSEQELVAEALAAGHLSIADEHGFHHSMYAVCTGDGHQPGPTQAIWRRGERGRYIDQLVFHCPVCNRTWQAEASQIHLR
jgi:hypothetical protein